MSPAAFSFAHPAEVHMHYLNSADLSGVNLLQHYSSEQKTWIATLHSQRGVGYCVNASEAWQSIFMQNYYSKYRIT
jgi:hypothetical protein